MELKIHDQEILLQKLWKSRRLFTQELLTSSGKRVEVIFAGAENTDSGPDFKDAVIKLDGKLLKGDVEVHLDSSGWYAHGHHKDPAYNKVILHLISNQTKNDPAIEREDGVQVQQIYVDIDLYKSSSWKRPKQPQQMSKSSSLVVGNCPLSRMADVKIWATIHEAGERRLSEKAAQVSEDLATMSWNQMMYKKILEALGYSKNQIPFRKLAQIVPFEILCQEMHWVPEEVALKKCAALLFGAAGLLPSQNKKTPKILDAETLDYIAPLEFLWDQISHRLEIKPMKSHEWQFFRLRPQNFPTRRIAGMVQLLFKFYRSGFLEGFLKIFYGNSTKHEKLITELEAVLIIKATGFWSNHFRFEEAYQNLSQNNRSALIGRDRARDIIINIIFPALYLHSSETNDGMINNLIRELFTKYPKLSENSITKAMIYQLFAKQKKKSSVIKSASQQQGLIYLHKLYCRSLKCQECLELSFK
ncbi:MAG: DUF2851 family protein [bacterium]